MVPRSPFTLLGLALLVVGLLLALTSYFILRYVPFTALGASTLILAAVALALGRGQPKVPPETSGMLLDSGLENTAALIEELGLSSKAIYLPSSLAGGKPRALLPLSPADRPTIVKPLPNRLVVRHGPNPSDMGILVTTLGSVALERFGPVMPGEDLEGALSSIIVGSADLADGIKAVEEAGTVIVRVANPRIEHESMKVFELIGTPLASVVASVVAEAKGAPVEIVREDRGERQLTIEITLAGRSP